MPLFAPHERALATLIVDRGFGNPFTSQRIDLERRALGADFIDCDRIIDLQTDSPYETMFPNVPKLHQLTEKLTAAAHVRLCSGHDAAESDLRLYEELVCYLLYNRHMSLVHREIRSALAARDGTLGPFRWDGLAKRWQRFGQDFAKFFEIPDRLLPSRHRPEHLFAVFFQVARAFHNIFDKIIGGSSHTSALRAAVWESIFTHDMRRYLQILYRHMLNFPTLIIGQSGTGKELVAQAIGRSLYAGFDPVGKCFDFNSFYSLNLSAFAPTLIELELFGSVKGAFSGATDRAGWLEACSSVAASAMFLDEIGELDTEIQVKLLRVLQERKFARLGQTGKDLSFKGKIITATNRDLAAEMRAGRFRPDFYYRLCADVITTPALKNQLAERPDELRQIVQYVVLRRVLSSDVYQGASVSVHQISAFVDELVELIERKLGPGYSWPGNFRELEQCVRNLMVRKHYQPPVPGRDEAGDPIKEFLCRVEEGSLSIRELRGKYFALILLRAGTLTAAGKRLGVDWRTLRRWIDRKFAREIGADLNSS